MGKHRHNHEGGRNPAVPLRAGILIVASTLIAPGCTRRETYRGATLEFTVESRQGPLQELSGVVDLEDAELVWEFNRDNTRGWIGVGQSEAAIDCGPGFDSVTFSANLDPNPPSATAVSLGMDNAASELPGDGPTIVTEERETALEVGEEPRGTVLLEGRGAYVASRSGSECFTLENGVSELPVFFSFSWSFGQHPDSIQMIPTESLAPYTPL